MDIISHTLAGSAIATCAAAFSEPGFEKKTAIISAGSFGAALPDIDAISLWRGFDSTFGKFFSLEHSGRVIYSGDFWYSHHNFFHSIAAGTLLTLFFGLILFILAQIFKRPETQSVSEILHPYKLFLFAFFLGYISHLLLDMPTPGSSWGGVMLFWPLDTFVGGFGQIWWWNNYDIFLILLLAVLFNTGILVFTKKKIRLKLYSLSVIMISTGLILYQINNRGFDFSYEGYTNQFRKYEAKSLEIQKKILGDDLYSLMRQIDNKIKLNF